MIDRILGHSDASQAAPSDVVAQSHLLENRRQFFSRASCGIGVAALASLLERDGFACEKNREDRNLRD